MIDSIRLAIPATEFAPADLAFLMSLQTKLTKSSWSGEVVKWAMIQSVPMPSWAEGFFLRVGSMVTLEGSPKVYQGHNVTGPADLYSAVSRLVNHVFGRVFGLKSWPDPALWYLRRVDVNYQYDFGTPEALACWMDTVKGVQRGVRRASLKSSPVEALSYSGYGPSQTLYVGQHSRYRAGKIYCKGSDLVEHPPKSLSGDSDAVHALATEFASVGRFELVMRALWLSDHAPDLGLVPAHFKSLNSGSYRENVVSYLRSMFLDPLVSKSLKEPLIYFPIVHLLNLDLDSLWLDEFKIFFSTEAAMNDATLLAKLHDIAPTSGQARKAYGFMLDVRVHGLAIARQKVSLRTWYRYRTLLNAAGVSDAQLQDGAPLVRIALDPVKIREFRPDSARLRLVEQAHQVSMDRDIERLRSYVFREVRAA
ncbi:MAG: phage/plasmid replication protein, II/X family [Gammaproteobacteria bacterium]|nr:phage/plasmid replication protein, II/X family [Gammaproteobacteria bacterium]